MSTKVDDSLKERIKVLIGLLLKADGALANFEHNSDSAESKRIAREVRSQIRSWLLEA